MVSSREGDCWDSAELPEFSEAAIIDVMDYDIQTHDGRRPEADEMDDGDYWTVTVTHLVSGMTIITYFRGNGESFDWVAPTTMFVE
jgi:hypothetical protein